MAWHSVMPAVRSNRCVCLLECCEPLALSDELDLASMCRHPRERVRRVAGLFRFLAAMAVMPFRSERQNTDLAAYHQIAISVRDLTEARLFIARC
jgi:hypothetical protein